MPMDLAPIFQQVFQTSATPTLLVAHNGTVLAGSDSLQALLGYSAASLQGKSIKSLVSANSPEWQSIVENHQPTSVSVALLSADAKTELVQLQLTPVTIAQESDPVWYVKLNPAPLSDLSHSDLFSGRGQYLEKVLQTITDGFLVMNKPLLATSSRPALITSPRVLGQWKASCMNLTNVPFTVSPMVS